MTVQFNLNNNEISKELLDNKFNMILENHGRLVLNDQKSPLPHSEPQISWVCSEAATRGALQNFSVLKTFANFTGKHLSWTFLQACNFIEKRL